MQFRVRNVFGMEDSYGKVGCGGSFGMDSESHGYLGEPLDSSNTCHHPDADQILSTTDAPHFPTCQSLREESRGSEADRRDSQFFKLILGLANRGVYDESLRIIVDLLKLIEDCITGC